MRGVGKNAGYHSFIEACVSDGNGLDGIELRSMHYASVYNSIVLNNDRHGISLNGRSQNNLIKDTRVIGSGEYGLKLWEYGSYAPQSTLVTDSEIADSMLSGIRIDPETVDQTMLRIVRVSNKNDINASCIDTTSSVSTSPKVQNLVLQDVKCDALSEVWFKGVADPGTCHSAGVMSTNVCCKLSCGKCGGEGCSKWGKDKSCCISTIRDMNNSCVENSPPCVVSY